MANALRRAKSSRPDGLALAIGLTCADAGLSRRGMACLLKLRQSQLRVIEQSRGALVRVSASRRPPWIDMSAACADSPLIGDYLSLFALQLAADYPERGDELREILHARRSGLNIAREVRALWPLRPATLLHGVLWIAAKPLCEAVARGFARHVVLPRGAGICPICGGQPWARRGKLARCAVCETAWQAEFEPGPWQAEGAQPVGAPRFRNARTGSVLHELDRGLFEHAFDAAPMMQLVRLLESGEEGN